IDGAGYITICGRVKRFAKIGGEMVSLTAVEATIYHVWSHHTHAVVQIPDTKKGEQLVLVTTYPNAKRSDIVQYVLQHQIDKLNIPKTILTIHEMPVLPTGKTNYLELQDWVKSTVQY
ncbi:MAG: bifunctional 2-acylglycerophosphoethanolamine acyltransferase/acyl-ACP synthetase, partial [Nitrosomonas sp.]|nr:bifunctional 2-acylglycerophosphoethanolamine acyltransferase/acyl-ACP synthetase [Nitrosomonas sp.]